VTKALGSAVGVEGEPGELPKPLASVLGYIGDDLDTRDFVPTAELIDALDVEPTPFGRQMGELGCQPRRGRITAENGTQRQARGYTTADLHAAAEEHCTNEPSTGTGSDS
jgi:S-DNA-T family DNA segregation ATPase FtsK/SpoIIIE